MMFSVLYPGSVIKPHCGISRSILRYHLCLQTDGNAELTINNTKYNWKENESILFDDCN